MTLSLRLWPLALLPLAALALSGCSSMRAGQSTAYAAPQQLAPIQTSTVATTALPPIAGDGTVQTADAGGFPGPLTPNANLTGQPAYTPSIDETQTASTDGSFVSLDAVGSVPETPGRDLTGGLSVGKLLGGWTIVSGATQCRLNLTQTAKSGTTRYRASTPGCQLGPLAVVSSWQLAGSQVQLFDDNNVMVAALILSGNRFIGTLSGGQGISMVG